MYDALVGGFADMLRRCALLVAKQIVYLTGVQWHEAQNPSHHAWESLHLRHCICVSLCYIDRSDLVIRTTKQLGNGNPEFRRRGQYRPQTDPFWE